GKIQVWQAKAGGTWQLQRPIAIADRPSTGATVAVALTPDGKGLAACSSDQAFVYVWSLTAETPAANYPRREGESLRCLAFSPDGQVIALPGRHGGLITLYDVLRQREVARLQHTEDVDRVAFSTDGKALVGSGSRSVGLWNLDGAEEKLTLSERGHNGGITGL